MNNPRRQIPSRRYPQETFGDRLIAAFLSLLLSLPAATLLWFLLNILFDLYANIFIPVSYLVTVVIVFAGVSFAYPKFAPSMLGKLYGFLLWVGKGW